MPQGCPFFPIANGYHSSASIHHRKFCSIYIWPRYRLGSSYYDVIIAFYTPAAHIKGYELIVVIAVPVNKSAFGLAVF